MKLSAKIPFLIGIVVIITVISLIFFIEKIMSNQIMNNYLDKLTVSVEANANLINSNLEGDLSKLWEVANRIRTRAMDWDGVTRESLIPDVRRMNALDLGLVYPDGLVRYVSDNATAQLGDREYIRKALSGQNNVSDVIISRVTNSLVLMFAVPVLEHSNPGASVIGAMIERRDGNVALRNIIRNAQALPGSHAFMINKEGTFVAHEDESLVFRQFNPIREAKEYPEYSMMGELFSEAIRTNSGRGRFIENGKSYFTAYTEIPGNQWILFIGLDENIVKAEMKAVRNNIILIALLFIIGGLVVSYFVGKSIANPVIQVTNVVQKISTGRDGYDLTPRIEIKSKDEIGLLAKCFNELLLTLKSPMCEIKNVINSSTMITKELASISSQLENGSNETVAKSNTISNITSNMVNNISSVAASSEEVSSSAKEVTHTAGQISSRMEAIVTAMDEMSRSIGKIADNTNKVSRVSDEANKKAHEANSVMESLEATANEIGDVTQTIKSIANKTNLLALNASVEAARAGDAGKGFAVVADEVKALANQSAISADDIDKKISDIQEEINRASTTFQGVSSIIAQINENVESIVGFIEQQAAASNSMANNVSETNIGAKTVATAISEVAKGSNLIANNANDISIGTNEVSENMVVMNVTANKGVEGAAIVSDFSNKLQEISADLKEAIGKFELGCGKCKTKICVSSLKTLEELTNKSKIWRNS